MSCGGWDRAVLYADDTNILLSNAKLHNLVKDSNHVSQKISDYCHSNGLILNSEKTTIVQFFPKNVSIGYSLLVKVDGKSINNASVIKFFGLNIDQKLKWEKHANIICAKVIPMCFLIRQLRHSVETYLLWIGAVSLAVQSDILGLLRSLSQSF